MTDVELLLRHSNTWNPLTTCKQMGNIEKDYQQTIINECDSHGAP